MTGPRLGVLISGGGTTLQNLYDRIRSGKLHADLACVVSSSGRAFGVERARAMSLPCSIIIRRKFKNDALYSQAIVDYLISHRVDLVVLAGFLKKFNPGPSFDAACINIHPALLPAFCGKGFYGMNVHRAVYERGCRVSGCSVHFVNEHYDAGPIIIQKTVALLDGDDPETIQKKVFQLECDALPEAIEWIASGDFRIDGSRVVRRKQETLC